MRATLHRVHRYAAQTRADQLDVLLCCTGSQFHALQQRIDEVEAQLALALSNTPSSAGRSRSHSVHGQEDEDAEEWAYKGDMVGEETIGRLEGKLHGCLGD